MKDIFQKFKNDLTKIIKNIAKTHNISIDERVDLFSIEKCKNEKHGDIATNVAMVFAKDFKKSPRDLANLIIKDLEKNKNISKIEIAGPGFININLNFDILGEVLIDILKSQNISLPNIGNGELINLEYASPNPTGPMHVGHCRGAIFGDVLAKLLEKTGFKITKEYYINDAGNQINNLTISVYLRYLELFGKKVSFEGDLYPGEYLIDIAKKLKDKFGKNILDQKDYINLIRDFAVDETLKIVLKDLNDLGIKHDILFSEKKNLHDNGKIEEAIEILKKKNLLYFGKISAPKGKKSENFKEEEQLLFRSTDFGDDIDRVIKKSNGEFTYFAADIAYGLDKFQRGAKKMILPLGYDHGGYVKRLKAAINAITDGKAEIEVILCQMVKFLENGESLKMSKRAGNFISARDVLDKVGPDILRFMMLSSSNDIEMNFDLEKAAEQSKDNPIFYIQYANVRCCSVLRNLENELPDLYKKISEIPTIEILKNLKNIDEINLIKKLALYPKIITMSVQNYEPHRINFYLQELAANIHQLWNLGIKDDAKRFIIQNERELTLSRIYLLIASSKIIKSALEIFGVKTLSRL